MALEKLIEGALEKLAHSCETLEMATLTPGDCALILRVVSEQELREEMGSVVRAVRLRMCQNAGRED